MALTDESSVEALHSVLNRSTKSITKSSATAEEVQQALEAAEAQPAS